jgi:hypothetical protein
MTKRRDPAEWVAYGQPGPGRPRISTEVEAVSATIPRADAEALDAAAARRGLRRPDMLREAVACYLRHHHDGPVPDDAG